MKNIFISVCICAMFAFITSCSEQLKVTVEEQEAPVLTNFTPNEGKIGTEVTIEGENLSNINSVTIGGGEAEIKYRIDNNKMVIKVTSSSLSGKIKIKNEVGESESAENFNITYAVPEIISMPQTFDVESEILIEGNNLEVVDKVTFGPDNIEGEITYQSENEILVIVPNVDEANVQLVYFDGVNEQTVVPENVPEINKPEPTFESFEVTEAEEGTTIDFIGDKLNLIEKIVIGTHEIQQDQFATHLENLISVTLPEVENDETGLQIRAIYYTDKEKVISNSFTIKNVLIYSWKNIKMGPDKTATGQVAFDASTNNVYTICDIVSKPAIVSNIHFTSAWSTQSGAKRLGFFAPSDSYGKVKSYKCESTNTKISDVITEDDFKEKCKNIRFYVLNQEYYADIINAVKSGNLTEIPVISEELDKKIVNSTAFYKNIQEAISGKTFVKGDVIIFKEVDGCLNKYGFIEILNLSAEKYEDDNAGKAGEITFNCYFQK